jgi:hypothetical protein
MLFPSDLLRQVGDLQVSLPHVGLLLLLLLLSVISISVLVAALLDPPLVFSPHSSISLFRGALGFPVS